MSDISAHQFLTIYIWFGLTFLVSMLLLIARFYERLSGQRTYYQFFVIPVLAFAIAAARLSSLDQIAGDTLGDSMSLVGGLSLMALCFQVYRLMTSGR
ncbi:MAG: hypothetical protein JW966_04180 [Anaerolineae bacterium]|nr:hypothetical protein [Anaerolineae bacterium]